MKILRVYNTLSRCKEEFILRDGSLGMFVCGPTVYDFCHLGHARTYIAFDVVAKYLRFKGYNVFFLLNITDVAEKVIEKSKKMGVKFLDLSGRYERYFRDDLESLGIDSVNVFARASDHIPEIIDQIKELIRRGFAYETETGVYFSTKKCPDYGSLSNQTPEDISLHPLELCSTKRDAEDFSLWRKIDEHPQWDSPWGLGRPGWHIEDTAIAMKFLGLQYDLHGGAVELIFPHHEAEIALGEALGKKPYVKYWLHTGILKIERRKMSKSLGNTIDIRDFLQSTDYRVLRFYLLSKHYRQTINFGPSELNKTHKNAEYIIKTLQSFSSLPVTHRKSNNSNLIKDLEKDEGMFIKSMDDDFNTPKALKIFVTMVRRLEEYTSQKREIDERVKKRSLEIVDKLATILGVL